jgi:uncharacterized protein YjiS (DUF1127 family)
LLAPKKARRHDHPNDQECRAGTHVPAAAPALHFKLEDPHMLFDPIARRLSAWRERRLAIRRLHQLDDRLLADLGVSRDYIARFVQSRSQT